MKTVAKLVIGLGLFPCGITLASAAPPDDFLYRAAPFVQVCGPAFNNVEDPDREQAAVAAACMGYMTGFGTAVGVSSKYEDKKGAICAVALSPRILVDLAVATFNGDKALRDDATLSVSELLLATYRRVSPCASR